MSSADSGLPNAFRWALEATADPERAACDWLAREIVPQATSAASAITDPTTGLEQLRALKTAFKALRQTASGAPERNRAARWYAATVAVALARFDVRISEQRDEVLIKAFRSLLDSDADDRLRDLAELALARLGKR